MFQGKKNSTVQYLRNGDGGGRQTGGPHREGDNQTNAGM